MARISIPLSEFASARSGDKGNHANIGVVARSPEAYVFLVQSLTAEMVHQWFQGLGVSRTVRYELPRVGALNFMLHDALAGGASRSLRLDTQGKLLGAEILDIPLSIDESELAVLRAGKW